MFLKFCPKCQSDKLFYGGSSKCMDCCKAYMNEYYAKNKERIRARVKAYDQKYRPEKAQRI